MADAPFIQGFVLYSAPTFLEPVRKITNLGCPPKIKNFQKGTLGGCRFGQKGIKRCVQKRGSSDFWAHCPPSEKRPPVAKRNPPRKASMLLSHKDYYCFLNVLSAPGPSSWSRCPGGFLRLCPKRGPFWDPFFFTFGPLGPKKGARGFNTGTCWLPGEAPEAPIGDFGGVRNRYRK